MIALKLVALFVAIFFTIMNTYRAMMKYYLHPLHVFPQVLGIFTFVVIQFRLYE